MGDGPSGRKKVGARMPGIIKTGSFGRWKTGDRTNVSSSFRTVNERE